MKHVKVGERKTFETAAKRAYGTFMEKVPGRPWEKLDETSKKLWVEAIAAGVRAYIGGGSGLKELELEEQHTIWGRNVVVLDESQPTISMSTVPTGPSSGKPTKLFIDNVDITNYVEEVSVANDWDAAGSRVTLTLRPSTIYALPPPGGDDGRRRKFKGVSPGDTRSDKELRMKAEKLAVTQATVGFTEEQISVIAEEIRVASEQESAT